jgi:transaldolase
MKLYIDSADRKVLESLMKIGVFHGVTTNPLILKAGGIRLAALAEFAGRVFAMGAHEIFFQSWGRDATALYWNGLGLADMSSKVVVKLPATREGLEAAARLSGEGVRTCVTALYSPYQALLAAAAGAAFAAPYLGRMNDAGRDGHAMIAQMAEALRHTESPTEILAASVRSPEDMAKLAQQGVCHITLSPAVAERLFQEPLTLEAAGAFEAAARELGEF